jgi:hypothetical protein
MMDDVVSVRRKKDLTPSEQYHPQQRGVTIIIMTSEESWLTTARCIICKERRAEPMTVVCWDEKCFQTFMDMQGKGKLKELLGI